MTERFTAAAWEATAGLQQAIAEHPFNLALADGTLDQERFRHFLAQDAAYLAAFSRVLSLAAARAPRPDDAALLARSAHNALVVERSLHAGYLQGEADEVDVSPVGEAYASFLLATAATAPFPVQVGSVLPCFWIYREVGAGIHQRTAHLAEHPYRAWIDTYADEDFSATVDAMISLADRLGEEATDEERRGMLRAFRRASEHEWLFWDSAWHLRGWPTARFLAP